MTNFIERRRDLVLPRIFYFPIERALGRLLDRLGNWLVAF